MVFLGRHEEYPYPRLGLVKDQSKDHTELTWLFFSDMSRVGGRRVGNQKTREQIRLGSESLAKLHRMPRKVAQKYSILYTISRGETIRQQDKFSRKLIKQSGRGNKQYLKNITGWAHRGCRTGNYSSIRWKELGSYNEKPQLP